MNRPLGVLGIVSLFFALVFVPCAWYSPVSVLAHSAPACPIPQATPGTFTLFWMTDTQFLSQSNPALFNKTTEWITQNYAACNGRMVIHTGDIVNDWNVSSEWSNADKAMSILLGAGIPYTWDAGNHDSCGNLSELEVMAPCDGSAVQYIGSQYPALDASYVASEEPRNWVSSSPDGRSTAVNFTADGQQFLIINIEYNGLAELPWVSGLLSKWPTAHVVIATHAYMNETGSIPGWDYATVHDFASNLTALMDKSPGVFLTLNGHYTSVTSYGPTDVSYHVLNQTTGRWELMFNRQDVNNRTCIVRSRAWSCGQKVGAASVTTLTFNLANDGAYVHTFDVAKTPQSLPSFRLPLAYMVSSPITKKVTSTSIHATAYGMTQTLATTYTMTYSIGTWAIISAGHVGLAPIATTQTVITCRALTTVLGYGHPYYIVRAVACVTTQNGTMTRISTTTTSELP